MNNLRKTYSDLLQMFIYDNEEEALYRADQLSKEFEGKIVAAEELVYLHHEVIMEIAKDLPAEKILKVINRGLVFLLGVIVAFGAKKLGGNYSKETLNNWIETVLRLNSSLELCKNKHKLILDTIPVGILTANNQGKITFINNELKKMFNLNEGSYIGKNLTLICEDTKDSGERSFIDLISETIETGKIFTDEEREYAKENIFKITTSPIRDNKGTLTEVIALIEDITKQKQLEKAVMENEKLATVGTLAAGIAHELRNPLTSVRGFFQLLKPELIKIHKEEYLDIILDELDRINSVITDFLNSTKPAFPRTHEIDTCSLLAEIQVLTESEALLRDIDLNFYCPANIPSLHIDKDQIKQVLLNIIKNAFDAVGSQGNIEVSAQWQAGSPKVFLIVKDNGVGMDQQTLARIFDPFYTTKENGTGLGMAVTYQIIRNHGGEIKVKSILGGGTRFIISLPFDRNLDNNTFFYN
ncbi:MAG: ATP-binding protein [Desulfitobacteriaceae bacterium]|nr:ATP-binding protein [Desulfitobacteriaceae bacterium]MDD4345782.1 ATP-binding protein [Desulfitobacteriaceae bacterium]MDD4401479.1 ATP-binding protein [Desulfitobacteriaceae bacterium]